MGNEIQFEIPQDQINILRKLHNALALKEMTEHPGWPLLISCSQEIIGRMENEHLSSASKMDRDRYWIQGAELSGARKYARLLTEVIAQQIASLEQDFVSASRGIDVADLDGELANAEDN